MASGPQAGGPPAEPWRDGMRVAAGSSGIRLTDGCAAPEAVA